MPSTLCLLEQLENAGCRVDVDSFDPAVAKALPFTPHDATSNQALIGLCIMNPDHHDMVSEVAKSMSDADPLDVLTVLVSSSWGFGIVLIISMPSSAVFSLKTSPAECSCSPRLASHTTRRR